MEKDVRQFLKTAAWLFMRHGQKARAMNVCAALYEDDPSDPASSVAYADLLLWNGKPAKALEAVTAAFPGESLSHAAAVLETRALAALGRTAAARSCWRRHVESMKGSSRRWM